MNALVASILLMVMGVAWWGLWRIEARARSDLSHTLRAVVATSHEGLRIWTHEVRANCEYLASLPEVGRLLQAHDPGGSSPDGRGAGDPSEALRPIIHPMLSVHGYHDFVVVALDGTQVAASAREMVGGHELLEQGPALIHAALEGKTKLEPPHWNSDSGQGAVWRRTLMLVAAPVRDEAGRVLGVLVLRLEPSHKLTQVTKLSRIGESGEVYAFDSSGYMVTESRFGEQLRRLGLIPANAGPSFPIALRDPGGDMTRGYRPEQPMLERPFTRMARSALAGESGVDVSGYRDYRGVPVVGAWTWEESLGLGLAFEMDEKDAFLGLRRTRLLVVFMLSVAIVGGAIVASFLGRRARILAMSMAREQALARERDELLALVSHDLRIPLSSIHLNTQLLMRQLSREPRPDLLRKRVEGIRTATERMVYLIENLLGAARMEAGQLQLERRPSPLPELVAKVVEMLSPLASAKEISLSVEHESSAEALVDPERLLQVFSNLIGNALKFTPVGGKITVRTRRAGGELQVSVADSGIGITAEALPHVFERYWRSKSSESGSGLGLYISKGIVEAHGGRIWVESQYGAGTTFHFTLPAAQPSAS